MRSLGTVVLLGLVGVVGYKAYVELNPCAEVIAYAVGVVDEGFGVSEEDYLSYIKEAEAIWEDEMGRELFRHEPSSDFTIDLIYDARQERTLEAKEAEEALDQEKVLLDQARASYDDAKSALESRKSRYDARARVYEKRLKEYNEEIEMWNSRGGAPQSEYARLNQESAALEAEARTLEQNRRSLNADVASVNAEAARLKEMTEIYNELVAKFNAQFGVSTEFNQGIYTGDGISIYQFSTPRDLTAVLAHELGHALGIDHVDDPNAVMYYKIDDEATANLHLTESDKGELARACGA